MFCGLIEFPNPFSTPPESWDSQKPGFFETPQARGNPILTPKTSTAIQSRRIRVGDYRIRYDLEGEEILLYRVRHRRDMYPD